MSTRTQDVRKLEEKTNNIYESIVVISKRARQISAKLKEELHQKLSQFATPDTEVVEDKMIENKEQTEISRRYERMPKSTEMALDEFLNAKIYWRNPHKEKDGNAN